MSNVLKVKPHSLPVQLQQLLLAIYILYLPVPQRFSVHYFTGSLLVAANLCKIGHFTTSVFNKDF